MTNSNIMEKINGLEAFCGVRSVTTQSVDSSIALCLKKNGFAWKGRKGTVPDPSKASTARETRAAITKL